MTKNCQRKNKVMIFPVKMNKRQRVMASRNTLGQSDTRIILGFLINENDIRDRF